MSSESDSSGKPDRESGSGGSAAPSRADGGTRTRARKTAKGTAAPEKKGGAAKTEGTADTRRESTIPPAAPDAASSSGPGSSAPEGSKTSPRPEEKTGAEKTGAEKTGTEKTGTGGTGDGGTPPRQPPPGDSSSGGGEGLPWGRLALYGAAGAVGGLIVALIFVLTAGRDDLPDRVGALESRIENLELGGGDPARAAALRRRLDALDSRMESLAGLSGSSPLVRQVSEIERTVSRLRGLVEGLEEGADGEARATLRADLERIDEELVRLDTRLAKATGELRRTETRLAARLESLEAVTPDDLPAQLEKAADRKTVETLLARVNRLERDEMTRDVRRAALALSLANLTRAVQTSQSFEHELKAIEALEPGNALVAELKPHAQSGVPSLSTLQGRFDKVAQDVVQSWRKAHGKGFFAGLWDNILGLFRVRPVGEAEGADAPAVVARAEQRLSDGDLYLAVRELAKLGEPEKEAADEWLGAAKTRLRLGELTAELNREVLEEIAALAAERKTREADYVPPAEEAPATQEAEPAPARPAPPVEPETGETPPESAPESVPEAGEAPSPDAAEPPDTEDEADANASER